MLANTLGRDGLTPSPFLGEGWGEVGFERQPCQCAGMGECRLARGHGQLAGEVGAVCERVRLLSVLMASVLDKASISEL